MTSASPGMIAGEALALVDVSKRFGPAVALDGASLTVGAGTLHAVLGENGAGKTTLMRVAFGLVRPDAGTVRVHGAVRRFASPADAIAAGIGMVHQHFTIVPAMTVAENVALGGRGPYAPRAAAARVRAVGSATGLALDPAAVAGTLPVAAQQRLEIVKALARAARVLILDEPAAVLGPDEAEELLGWLRRWVDGGGTAVLVTHKLRDALRHADAVTVLRRGRTVLARPVRRDDDTLDEGRLAAAMLGDASGSAAADATGDPAADGMADGIDGASPGALPPAPDGTASRVVVRAERVRVVDAQGVVRVRDATLTLRAGELVGVAAVEGSGQHELLRLLAGRVAPAAGVLDRPGRVAFVPEDRHRDALLVDGSLVENLALAGAAARRGRVPWGALAARTAALVAAFDVRGGEAGTAAGALSGGNQQKFVVARELAGAGDDVPALVVAENPTRGLDIRASAAVRARLRAARDAGAAVVVYSSDLDEVLALADRVLVVHDGRVYDAPPDRDAVGRLMLGAGG